MAFKMKGPSVQAGTSAHRSALKEIGDSLEKMNRGAKASPVKDDPSKKELDKREKELKDAQKKQEKIDAEKEAGVISKEDLKKQKEKIKKESKEKNRKDLLELLVSNIEKHAKSLGIIFLFTVCGNKYLEKIHKKLDWWIDKSRTSYEIFKYI